MGKVRETRRLRWGARRRVWENDGNDGDGDGSMGDGEVGRESGWKRRCSVAVSRAGSPPETPVRRGHHGRGADLAGNCTRESAGVQSRHQPISGG